MAGRKKVVQPKVSNETAETKSNSNNEYELNLSENIKKPNIVVKYSPNDSDVLYYNCH